MNSFYIQNPQSVRDFLATTARGYHYVANNKEQAINECGSSMSNVDPAVMLASLNYMAPSWFTSTGQWGVIDPTLVDSYTQRMINGGFTTATIDDIAGSYTNEFNVEASGK